jgi:hypothetical protein
VKKIAIAIDNWKLPIFDRHLSQAGYTYAQVPFTDGTMLLKAETTNAQALAQVTLAANTEAARTGAPK